MNCWLCMCSFYIASFLSSYWNGVFLNNLIFKLFCMTIICSWQYKHKTLLPVLKETIIELNLTSVYAGAQTGLCIPESYLDLVFTI